MIRNVKIESGQHSIKVSLDKNLYFKNTWTRIAGSPLVCPKSGTWRYGTAYNSHYLYLIDDNDESILYLSNLGINGGGNKGLGEFLSDKHAIAQNLILDWEITSVQSEWTD